MAAIKPQTQPLVDLLQEAAKLEHCLLNTYLYAACSAKTLPAEFATLPDGRENRRRALQFERVRAWKQAILDVAHEEMLHLHYVQCLIRALGADPYFGLPERDPETGNWLFAQWRQHSGTAPANGAGTEVPVQKLSPDTIRRFVRYESTDSLQDEGPFGDDAMQLYRDLHAFELDVTLETTLSKVTDPHQHDALREQLRDLYVNLAPNDPPAPVPAPGGARAAVAQAVHVEEIRFQSIADLYLKAILPLYQDAMHYGEVPKTDRDLEAEQRDPNYAAEGFLPIRPIYRDLNYKRETLGRQTTPITDYRKVEDVINEIVEEGEGQQAFEEGARALLATVQELGGAREYLTKLGAYATDDRPWLDRYQAIRLSHLYRFAIAMIDLDDEIKLAHEAGTGFDPARTPVTDTGLQALADSLPAQFNAAYLSLVMWLSRMYEIKSWESDRRRRMGIEMLAAWPLMSVAIRPLLELASFVPVDTLQLFRLEELSLPDAPPHARELLALYSASERSQQIDDRMDYYALRALSDVADWAAEQRSRLAGLTGTEPHLLGGMISRLDMLATLGEFERQFPFREHGGYSDRAPDLDYQLAHPYSQRYEEDGDYDQPPDPDDPPEKHPVFQNCFVLRARFGGRQLVQLATDPDPPVDEAGCQGTHMLHAADGDDRRFDRSLVWQPEVNPPANVIRREPREQLPPVGVRVQAVDVLIAGPDGAESSYQAIGSANSTGAVQAQGLQQIPVVSGLDGIETLDAQPLLISLLPKDGQMPFLNGNNHVVSRDGEPIDPFIVALLDAGGSPICQREIFNEGKKLLEMEPFQRLCTLRWPCGFTPGLDGVPAWAMSMLSAEERKLAADPTFPFSYLGARATTLGVALTAALDPSPTDRAAVDQAISFAERLRLVANPRGTTVGWLPLVFFYGHTVSGEMQASGIAALTVLGQNASGLELALAPAGRDTPNGRWFVTYNLGYMDTDALSAMTYGELFIPLSVTSAGTPVSFTRTWQFPAAMGEAVAKYGARFDAPFWAKFTFTGDDTRTITLPDKTELTEKLKSSTSTSYTYTLTGVKDISNYEGSFTVTDADDLGVELTWTATFVPATAEATVTMFAIIAPAATTMTDKLAGNFSPVSSGP